MQPLLDIQDLSIDFVTENEKTEAVKNISLTIHSGEIVALVGESGSGKSVTSLSLLQLLPSPPARYPHGRILFYDGGKEYDLLKMDPTSLQHIRGNRIGIIFQEPMTALNPVMTCGKQVAETLVLHKQLTKAQARQRTLEWFRKVQLPSPEAIYDRYPHQLSGGQKQRVMIALAMCCEPALLICDEPTTALDVTVQKTILQLIRALQQEKQMGVLFITHDLGVVSEIADRVAVIYKGEILETGSTDEIFTHPRTSYTKALLACRPANHPGGERLPVVADFLENRVRTEVIPSQVHHERSGKVLAEIKNLVVQFPVRTNMLGKVTEWFTAVDDVSLDIYEGETLGLVGESGCGKTTLGRSILRLVEPSSGSIAINGQDITRLDKRSLKRYRQQVQLVFQDPFSSLNPRITIGDAIAEPLKVTGIEMDHAKRRSQVNRLLEQVGLPSSFARRFPHEFSGGQRQRIVIARALALGPGLLVCDESVSALDVSVQAQVLNLLNDLKKELGLTLLFISHDLSVVRYMSDRIAIMKAGRIVEMGTAGQVYNEPRSEYTRSLLDAIPHIRI